MTLPRKSPGWNNPMQEGLVVLQDFVRRYGPPAGPLGPEQFVEEVLGATPDDWQRAVLRDYGASAPGVSIRSCHGPGKTTVLAWCILHQLVTRFPQKTVSTAPTKNQLEDALIAETKAWLSRLPEPLHPLFEAKSDRIELVASRAESFVSFRVARAETPEALQGVHAPWVLIIPDEASGVPEPVFEAAAGSMAGANRTTIMAGNPTRTAGTFFDSHHRTSHLWKTYHIYGDPKMRNTYQHPNSYYSARVPESFVKMMAARYGEESNAYRVRVLGEFPRSDLDTVIPYELVASAKEREIAMIRGAMVREVWGLDVAWKGDDRSALCKRRGKVVPEPVRVWRDMEAMQLVGAVKAEWDARPDDDKPVQINVDAINYGEGVASRLRELGLPAVSINVAETPALTGDRYQNLRTELAYQAREWLAARDCSLPEDEKLPEDQNLTADLVSIKYEIVESNGKLQLEPKKRMKSRGLKSPDLADAFFLTFAGNASIAAGLGGGAFGRREAIKRNLKGVV